MSSTLLEVTRATHEDTERLERLIVKVLKNDPAINKKRRLSQMHLVRYMINQIISTTRKLAELYEDKDNARKDEIEAAFGGQTFHDMLKEIRDYHRRFPSARVFDETDLEYEHEVPDVKFSGEEANGRYLDMHALHNEYVNSRIGKEVDYASFLEVFSLLQVIPQKLKKTRAYKEYLSDMLVYLMSFVERTDPLLDLERLFVMVEDEFNEQWADQGKVKGIGLDGYSSAEELVALGPEKLKEALGALGLKTGGTVQQRAERLFLTKHTSLEELDRKQFMKKESTKEIALMEAKMLKLCEISTETIIRTKENAEKKQGLIYEEMEVDREDDHEDELEIVSEGDYQKIYNPLKFPIGWDGKPIQHWLYKLHGLGHEFKRVEFPIGWDGKPIQHWLYKLHGLGHEFKCEICGNYTYRGRRAYEHHFKESRHQYGMRQLGIPNTKDFNEITSIVEARQLWEKIKEKQGMKRWRPEVEEEYEDQEGNIYNKKTYTDLKRQCLI
ncbi:splicing factor SF3a60 [Tanacetum coccineum]|uniref:Splicing factor SF3a60 n=1 Tax=Tanacetum coccineum TaxID=301880 RepID=A0ABQ5B877_9ASTR